MKPLIESLLDNEEDLLDKTDYPKIIKNIKKDFPETYKKSYGVFHYKWKSKDFQKLIPDLDNLELSFGSKPIECKYNDYILYFVDKNDKPLCHIVIDIDDNKQVAKKIGIQILEIIKNHILGIVNIYNYIINNGEIGGYLTNKKVIFVNSLDEFEKLFK